MIQKLFALAAVFLICIIQTPAALALDAGTLVVDSFNYMRGKASVATVEMVIHRPDWERRMTI
ncbi:MAG: outer membrane lipoprotein-sorting protein, partial [Planctomycetota bacterium]